MCESHVKCLRLCCAGVTVYKGELVPLWSAMSPGSAAIGAHNFSCFLIGWQLFPGSHSLPNVTLFTLSLKVHVSLVPY